MIDKRKISICIPVWNRMTMVIESFEKVLNDNRISHVLICDDASTDGCMDKLVLHFMNHPKVHFVDNDTNVDCYANKKRAVENTNSEFLVLLDSDNVIDNSYIDAIYAISKWDENTFYTPSFAKPHFDFRKFEGLTLSKENISQFIGLPSIEVCLNAANYFVNRETYLRCFDESVNPVTSDTIFMASRLLEMGGKIHIVPNMHYEHRIHDGSHYKNNNRQTPKGFHQSVIDKLKNMK